MSLAKHVQELFPGFPFGAPVTPEDMQRAEHLLGEPIPPVLRDLYFAFDGFRGPTNAQFFWPLLGKSGLVDLNSFFRAGDEFPKDFVSSCIFFGDDGTGPVWGIKRDLPGSIIRWDAEWGEDHEVVGTTPLDVWARSKHKYESIA